MFSSRYVRRIEFRDCDPAQIVFNANFYSFFDFGTHLLFEQAGWPVGTVFETFDILGFPLVESTCRFRAPCTYGDEVTITSTIAGYGRSSFEVHHTLTKDGVICVEGVEKRVWAVRDPETGQMKSAPLPEDVIARFNQSGPPAG